MMIFDDHLPFSFVSYVTAGVTLVLAYRIYIRLTREARLARYFTRRHVWVVGASQGLGRALCVRLHQLGATITISSRSTKSLASVSAACDGCRVVPLDVCSGSAAIQEAWNSVNTESRLVNSMIINAGVNHRGLPFESLCAKDIDTVLNTNIRGAAHLMHAAVTGGMCHSSGSNICVVSSLAAYRGVPGASVYGASKAALSALAESVNIELLAAKKDLRVVAVHPGFISTPAIANLSHPKPFLLSSEQAADLVLDAIACNQRHYGFPWPMEHVVARFQRMLPSPLYEYIMQFG